MHSCADANAAAGADACADPGTDVYTAFFPKSVALVRADPYAITHSDFRPNGRADFHSHRLAQPCANSRTDLGADTGPSPGTNSCAGPCANSRAEPCTEFCLPNTRSSACTYKSTLHRRDAERKRDGD